MAAEEGNNKALLAAIQKFRERADTISGPSNPKPAKPKGSLEEGTDGTPKAGGGTVHGKFPEHLDYDLGRRKVRFHSLTKPEIENIARDIEDGNKLSIYASISLTALVTFIIEIMVNDFGSLPAYGQAVIVLATPISFVLSVFFGIQWFRNKKPVRTIIDNRLKEIDEEGERKSG